MFLPSLPIILPFISSLGSATTDTVVSDVWSAAHFCIANPIISLAFLFASSFAFASDSFISAAFSSQSFLSNCSSNIFLASSPDSPEILCNVSVCFASNSSNFLAFSSFAWIFLSNSLSLFSKLSARLSKFSSFWIILFSCSPISPLLSLISSSKSVLAFKISSLAFRISSFLVFSASFFAFCIIFSASLSALLILDSAVFFLSTIPVGTHTAAEIRKVIMAINVVPPINNAPLSI